MSMVIELLVRFVVGGLVVSVFALICDLLRPKSFAGIFSAAPSVACATLGLTYVTKGPSVVALEGSFMMAGAAALAVYGLVTGRLLLRIHRGAARVAVPALGVWLLVAFGLWAVFAR